MARLQNALRVYALDGLRPSVALERMNGFAREAAGGPMATMLYGAVDPERGRMHLASAGIHRRWSSARRATPGSPKAPRAPARRDSFPCL